MSDLPTSCFSSRGELGRKRTKARRFFLREQRRRGELACPSDIATWFADRDRPIRAVIVLSGGVAA